MKKKILCALLAACMAAVGAGCSAGDARVNFDADKPWSNYETSTYKIERFFMDGETRVKTVAEGTYVSTLRSDTDKTTVKNEFTLAYNDEPETTVMDERGNLMVNKGLTDKFNGEVTFANDSLAPVSAARNTNFSSTENYGLAQRPLNDSELPALQESSDEGASHFFNLSSGVKYSDPRGYSYTVDYEQNKAKYSTTSGSTSSDFVRTYKNVNTEISLAGNTRFENEQLNYVVRALSAINREGNATFYLASIHDSYARGDYVRYTMNVSCDKNHSTVDVSLPGELKFVNPENQEIEKSENGKYSLPCVKATVSVSSETPGPGIKFYVTDPSITVIGKNNVKTKKLITQIVFTEYAVTSAKLAYETVYTLIDYTNSL